MDRLQPLEKLERDYYLGDRGGWYSDGEDRNSDSSDDEMVATLSRLAGVRRPCSSSSKGKRKVRKEKDEFEAAMDTELNERFVAHSAKFMAGTPTKAPICAPPDKATTSAAVASTVDVDDEEMPSLEGDSDEDVDDELPSLKSSVATSAPEKTLSSILKNPKSSGEAAASSSNADSEVFRPKKSVSIKEEPHHIVEKADDMAEGRKVNGEENGAMPKSAFDEEDNLLRRAVRKLKEDVAKETVDFYDPDEDECNEQWVREHRERLKIVPKRRLERKNGHQDGGRREARILSDEDDDEEVTDMIGGGHHRDGHEEEDGRSDAVLSCPACMCLLTRDCQRHSFYRDQYRAMFVENCKVVVDQTLFLPQSERQKRGGKKANKKSKLVGADGTEVKPKTTVSTSEAASLLSGVPKEDLFHPVLCGICSTNVGVYDNDEIYHFFNVLTGYS